MSRTRSSGSRWRRWRTCPRWRWWPRWPRSAGAAPSRPRLAGGDIRDRRALSRGAAPPSALADRRLAGGPHDGAVVGFRGGTGCHDSHSSRDRSSRGVAVPPPRRCVRGLEMPNTLRVAFSSLGEPARRPFMLLLFLPVGHVELLAGLGVSSVVFCRGARWYRRILSWADWTGRLVERRMHAGPMAETRLCPEGPLVVGHYRVLHRDSGGVRFFDHRFGVVHRPRRHLRCSVTSMVAVGLWHGHAGGLSVPLRRSQHRRRGRTSRLVSTGFVRGSCGIRCYSGSVVMMIGVALALGSYWALLIAFAGLALMVVRRL